MTYVINFSEWAENIFKKFEAMHDKSNNFKVFQDKDITIIVNIKTMRMGIAKRKPNETPDKIIGIAVAYARYLNIEIPKELKVVPIGTLAPGTSFKFMASDTSDTSTCYIIGKVPINQNIICYCYEYEIGVTFRIRTTTKDVPVYAIN